MPAPPKNNEGAQKVDYHSIAAKHNGVSLENPGAIIPPQEQRIADAIGVNVVQGKPYQGYGGDSVIASVGEHEPHTIVINDRDKFNQGPKQNLGHEIIHLAMNNLAGPVQAAIPPDDPKHPYDISQVDELRKKGYKLWNLPQEKAARVVQLWIANPNPQSRARLQPWIDDLNNAPLSVMNATSPDQKGINTTPRPPAVPIQAYTQK